MTGTRQPPGFEWHTERFLLRCGICATRRPWTPEMTMTIITMTSTGIVMGTITTQERTVVQRDGLLVKPLWKGREVPLDASVQ